MGDEIPKWMKIAFICISVVCFITAFLLIILPETYIEIADPTLLDHFDSISLNAFIYYLRADGVLVLSFAIFSLIAIKVNDFEKIQKYLEFAILWVNLAICLNIYSAIVSPETGMQFMITALMSKIVIDFVYLYYYFKQIRT